MDKVLRIITSEKFDMAFSDFVSHKMSLGFSVAVLSVEGFGKNPQRIKEYIENKYKESYSPYHLLLGGDETIVPSFNIYYPKSGERYRDGNYAVLINDKNQENKVDPTVDKWICAVGRLPGSNATEINKMCNQIIAYEKEVAGRQDSFLGIATTKPNSEFLDSFIKEKKFQDQVFLSSNNLKGSNLLAEIQNNMPNKTMICYNGHGSSKGWKLDSDNLFQEENIPCLTASPHILSWACNTANIKNSQNLGSAFLKKGAISFLGACCMTYGSDNRTMCQNILTQYTDTNCPETLGELYFKTLSTHSNSRESLKYMLLGDPSLKIK